MRRCSIIAFAVLGLAVPLAARGQKPIEIGIDGALVYSLDSPHGTSLTIPAQRVRAGFFVTPTVSVEPSGSLFYEHTGDNSATFLGLGVGALFHLSAQRTSAQPYVRPFVSLNRASYDNPGGDDSRTLWSAGAGVGVKVPIAQRFAWRLEGAYSHGFKNGTARQPNSLQALFGLSYLTR